ncbi:MAG TPA: beta-ketoacyl synthase N-terminal-like domain-containing protein [Micromonosporaceae bacterium]|nr:beta-ketoacyl synthase N-terminal-like domain-containing protein [Micromonosporaceae bacterium]
MIESRDGRRVVVTGVGVLASCGIGAADFWAGLAKTPAPLVVRRVPGFTADAWGLSRVEARRLDLFAQYGIAAAAEALVDGGLLAAPAAAGPLDGVDPDRIGVLIGTGIGGAVTWELQAALRLEKGDRAVSPLTVPMVMPNAAAAAVSMRWDLRGPCEAVVTACATGTHAIANAARWVAAGRADLALAGAAEASLTGTNVAGYHNMRALSPSGISRPFDVDRDGFCAAEGAAVVLVEEAAHAAARGARAYAEVAGSAANADAFHLTAPAPGGRGALDCMRLALADAGLAPADITHVNAHGTSTQLNDVTEARVIRQLFGVPGPAVTSIKGVTGHAQGAAGAIEAAALLLAYAHRTLPPTMGTVTVDPECGIDVVLEPRPWEPAGAISNSFGFGGHNGTLVFRPA